MTSRAGWRVRVRALRRTRVPTLMRGLAVLMLAHLAPRVLAAQDRGAAALGDLVRGLGTSARVLVIAAHPDDEDTQLITWLARGRQVETAYLSLTRGDGGQNLIGNELGEALGAIRTEELLAARRVDGGHQFFTRAYDFGFSKTANETYEHWPKDSILGDVVRVVRSFRPHVIVAVFGGTPRDGHGHHQVSGILAREAYEISGDTVRFPRARFGAPWAVRKFYRGARFAANEATLKFDVGEYNPLLGRGYAELSGESRSQHKSQGFGVLQRKGEVLDYVRREASRVNEATPAAAERSILDGVDTTWTRLATAALPGYRRAMDSVPALIGRAHRALDLFEPEKALPALDALLALVERLCPVADDAPGACATVDAQRHVRVSTGDGDIDRSMAELRRRVRQAIVLAAGVSVEATVNRAVWAQGQPVNVALTLYNRGRQAITVRGAHGAGEAAPTRAADLVAPGATWKTTLQVRSGQRSEPYWLRTPRTGDIYHEFATPLGDDAVDIGRIVAVVDLGVSAGGATVPAAATVVYRFADPVKGEIQRPAAVAPAVTLTLGSSSEYAPANAPFTRRMRVTLRSAAADSQSVTLSLALPAGVTADSATRMVALPPASERVLEVQLRGRLAPGNHVVRATATASGQSFDAGYAEVDHDHIRPQYLYRPAALALQAVDLALPPRTNIAYVQGVGDNVAAVLTQLGFTVTLVDPAKLARTPLADFAAVVVGPRAYEASAELVAQNAALLDYARRGGTVVVQYGQFEMARPGMLPYPITLGRPATRVTLEQAPVTVLNPAHALLTGPNRITARDFDGWVQERGLYMPSAFDPHWTPLLEMHDPGEPENSGALLVAPYGQGTYVYVTLALFRQLPAGVPGAARLIANMIAAGQRTGTTP